MGEHKFKPTIVPDGHDPAAPVETEMPSDVQEVQTHGIGFAPMTGTAFSFVLFEKGETTQVVTNGDLVDPLQLLAVLDDIEQGGGETDTPEPTWEDADPTATYIFLIFPRPGWPQARLYQRNCTLGHLRAAFILLRKRAEMNLDGILRGQHKNDGNGMLGAPRLQPAEKPKLQLKKNASHNDGISAIADRLKALQAVAPSTDKIDAVLAGRVKT